MKDNSKTVVETRNAVLEELYAAARAADVDPGLLARARAVLDAMPKGSRGEERFSYAGYKELADKTSTLPIYPITVSKGDTVLLKIYWDSSRRFMLLDAPAGATPDAVIDGRPYYAIAKTVPNGDGGFKGWLRDYVTLNDPRGAFLAKYYPHAVAREALAGLDTPATAPATATAPAPADTPATAPTAFARKKKA